MNDFDPRIPNIPPNSTLPYNDLFFADLNLSNGDKILYIQIGFSAFSISDFSQVPFAEWKYFISNLGKEIEMDITIKTENSTTKIYQWFSGEVWSLYFQVYSDASAFETYIPFSKDINKLIKGEFKKVLKRFETSKKYLWN